jgi:hypothetical protein
MIPYTIASKGPKRNPIAIIVTLSIDQGINGKLANGRETMFCIKNKERKDAKITSFFVVKTFIFFL